MLHPPSKFYPRPHFLIHILFPIRIFSSAFSHPSVSVLYPPFTYSNLRFIQHPQFLIRIFSSASVRIRVLSTDRSELISIRDLLGICRPKVESIGFRRCSNFLELFQKIYQDRNLHGFFDANFVIGNMFFFLRVFVVHYLESLLIEIDFYEIGLESSIILKYKVCAFKASRSISV